ncbi:MAG: aa3-type cytochrome c oxidase subunit IV [Defluviimonas sp.]|nr:aa3-type cytochrome c oxidase subunit IV [Defluviimonas sp.]
MADHTPGSDHKPGNMDIRVQEKTFTGFVRFSTWAAGLAIVVLIFLALANS